MPLLDSAGAGGHFDPVGGEPGSFEDAARGASDFRADSVAGDENNFVLGHKILILAKQLVQCNRLKEGVEPPAALETQRRGEESQPQIKIRCTQIKTKSISYLCESDFYLWQK